MLEAEGSKLVKAGRNSHMISNMCVQIYHATNLPGPIHNVLQGLIIEQSADVSFFSFFMRGQNDHVVILKYESIGETINILSQLFLCTV